MTPFRCALSRAVVTSLLVVLAPGSARAQKTEQPGSFTSLEAIDSYYSAQSTELDRRKIADLAALAARQAGAEAGPTYRELFNLAVAHDLCSEAEPAAKRSLSAASASHDVKALATFVTIIAKAQRGEFDRALDDLRGFIKAHSDADDPDRELEGGMVLAVGEATFQHLIRAGHLDVARKVCALACEGSADPVVKSHFEARLSRVNLLGKPAPPISGTDVDGKPVRLADLKGKVVLVDFWATWCPPCAVAIPNLAALLARDHDRGFEIIGLNMDARHENVKDARMALPIVRRFLVEHGVTWPNLINDDGPNDFAKAYGVETIPANFLIDRDGKVVDFELTGRELEKSLAQSLGGSSKAEAK